jgi:hypothetical protein
MKRGETSGNVCDASTGPMRCVREESPRVCATQCAVQDGADMVRAANKGYGAERSGWVDEWSQGVGLDAGGRAAGGASKGGVGMGRGDGASNELRVDLARPQVARETKGGRGARVEQWGVTDRLLWRSCGRERREEGEQGEEGPNWGSRREGGGLVNHALNKCN